jgi:serine/threonine protein kinase
MPSDSIAGFLDQAQAVRVLFPEQIEQLIRQPDIPQSDLSKLCEYLLTRGVVTRFQAEAIREARGQELNFAGYPIVDEFGPCPGGIAYKALHPSLRTPVVLRRLRSEWLAPADNGANYVARARAYGMAHHANAVPVLDVGFHRDELYVVLEQPAGTVDLDSLTREVGGAMPGFLAAEYARTVASVLRMAHQLGGVHGDVRPANLLVGPLVVKTGPDGIDHRRPAPDAVLHLAELGLVPLRPPAAQWAHDVSPYLPPERIDGTAFEPRGDIYGLGATLYFLLTGGPPFVAAEPAELLNLIRSALPTPLSELRPDLPPQLIGLVERMMEKSPERRPATAFDVESALSAFCRPGAVPAQPIPQVVSMTPAGADVPEAEVVPDAGSAQAEEDSDGWGVEGAPFAIGLGSGDGSVTPRRRESTRSDRARTRLLLVLGGLLHLTGVALVIAWALGAFKSAPVEESTQPPQIQEEPAKVPKKVRTVPTSE